MSIKRFSNYLETFIDWLSMLFFTIFFLAICIQVFSRYVLNSPVVWSEELARYINIWFVFFCSSILIKNNGHLKVDLINRYLTKLPDKVQIIYSLVINLLIILMLPILIYGSWALVKDTWAIELVTLKVPRGLIFLSLFISGFFMLFFALENLFEDLVKIVRKEN